MLACSPFKDIEDRWNTAWEACDPDTVEGEPDPYDLDAPLSADCQDTLLAAFKVNRESLSAVAETDTSPAFDACFVTNAFALLSRDADRCAAQTLAPGAALLAVERAVFLGVLARGLGIEARVEDRSGPRPLLLGERGIAEARVRFLWLDRPRWSGLGGELHRMASGSGLAAMVLVVAHPSQVPAEREREVGGVRVFWMALADVASWEDRRLSVDLADVILGLDLSVDLGPLLWPRYELVIDQRRDQVWYGGRLIRPTGMTARFLELLAARPGEVVTRREVILALWGDQIKRGKEPVFERYDQRLRQIRSELGQVFKASDPPMSLPKDPVELVRGEDDLRGGTDLTLRPRSRKRTNNAQLFPSITKCP